MGTRRNFTDGDGYAPVDRSSRRSVYWPCCCWLGSYYSTSSSAWNPDDDAGHVLSPWSWTARPVLFMSCFKRSTPDQPPALAPNTRQPLLEAAPDIEERTPRDQPTSDRDRFTKETSALVRQASNVAAKVQKQHERMSRDKHKTLSAWNILRRGSSTECKNSEPPPMPVVESLKQRQMSLVPPVSPKVDGAKKRLLHFRRQTTTDAAPNHRYHDYQTRPGGGRGRMSIVAKDWDSVHKVHDPESDVGGVYIGDEESNGSKRTKVTNGRVNGEFQGAFTAMKISESTDCKLSMIDDEGKE